jgi:uncharacterized protein YbaP (TraB family)
MRLMTLIAPLVFGLWANVVVAQCNGQDLRPQLPPEALAQLSSQVAETPYPEGNHWLAEKGETRIHLIGTMHLPDPRSDAALARLRDVILGADVVMLEATDAEKAQLQRAMSERPEILMLREGSLIDLMPAEAWQTLSAAVEARGMPPFMASRFQPWYLMVLLAIPPCLDMARVSEDGMDAQIANLAKANGIPTKAVEPYDTVFRVFGALPLDLQLDMVSASIQDNGTAEDMTATLTAIYFEEAHVLGWDISRIVSEQDDTIPQDKAEAVFDHLTEQMLTARNTAWIPAILDHATGKTAVVAAGAAHLGGEAGVLNLLAQQGFTLSRQPF